MRYRLADILLSESNATAGTKTIDLTVKDPISALSIQMKSTNNGITPTAHPIKRITKVELVDGSEVLYSMSGYEGEALQINEGVLPAFGRLNYFDDTQCISVLNMVFGRWLYDPLLAIDSSKHRGLQLKITHNLALGGCVPDASTLEVVAYTFDEFKPTPIGFLCNKELQSYALTANAYEYITIPTDRTLRSVMIQSLYAQKQPWEQYNEIRLEEDNGKRVPLDAKTSNLFKYFNYVNPVVSEVIAGIPTTAGVTFYCTPSLYLGIVASGYATTVDYFGCDTPYGGTFTWYNKVAGSQGQAIVSGYGPHGALVIPFGDPKVIEDWYSLPSGAGLKARIKAGSSIGGSSTCQVTTQQLWKY
jgi:hypothetical protein